MKSFTQTLMVAYISHVLKFCEPVMRCEDIKNNIFIDM